MALFVPAILEKEKAAYQQLISELAPYVERIQVDFADNTLVPNRTVLPAELARIDTAVILEAHLMVSQPVAYLARLAELGYRSVVVHQEQQTTLWPIINQTQSFGLELGVALNPETAVDQLLPEISKVDFVQIMAVDPGFGGQAFQPRVLEKIPVIKQLFNDTLVAVDGGIRLGNAQSLVAVGVDRLVVGRGGWLNNGDVATSIRAWQALLRS